MAKDFLKEYVADSPELAPFYANAPGQLFDSPPQTRQWHPELVDAIRDFQTSRGATPTFKGDEAVIITGQQPGIFTGPLYTIYKALTAIEVARKLEEKHGVPVVPVFWVGSEDHDFEEASTTHFLTRQHETLTIQYAPDAKIDGLPMHQVPMEASMHQFIDQAATYSNGSEFRDEVAELLHTELDAAESLSDWTARLLIKLFKNTPIVFFAPHLAAGRNIAAEIIAKEIQEPLKTTTLLNEAGAALEKLGFQPQVIKNPTECSFFLDCDGQRQKVLFENGCYVIPNTDQQFTPDQLLTLLSENPERFSPNVALRCIVQQHLFPTAAYVAGPGELAYWAQLKGLFEHFSLPMPTVYPRASVALTTTKLDKLKNKLDLSIEDLSQHEDTLFDSAVRNTSTNPALVFEREQRQQLETSLANLAEGLKKNSPTGASMAEALGKEVAQKLDRIERAITHSDEDKNEATRKQLKRLCNSLAPQRKPQERMYNIFSYLFEHGWDLIPRLQKEIDIDTFQTREIEL